MKLRMWVGETDRYGSMSDHKFYVDDPVHIPRIGEFIDGDLAGGWVHHIQWNLASTKLEKEQSLISTVYVYLKEKKNG